MEFPTTNWAKLAEATLSGGDAGREALGWICQKYHEPVEVIMRSRDIPEDQIEDLRQEFFVTLMKGSFFSKAEQTKGRFRNFLLKALNNFLTDEKRRKMALKRGGAVSHVELEEDAVEFSPDAEAEFDMAWAHALFHSAVNAVGEDVIAKRGAKVWQMLKAFLTGDTTANYKELGKSMGMSEMGAKNEVSRMRSKFRRKLRSELWLTVSAPHEVNEELEYLSRLIGKVWKTVES